MMSVNSALAVLYILCIFSASNCYADAGQVVDADTGSPIPGAYVFATWEGSFGQPNPVHNTVQRACFAFALTQIGSNGKYTLPDAPAARPPQAWGVERRVSAYAAGYDSRRSTYRPNGQIALKTDKRGNVERLGDLMRVTPNCDMADSVEAKQIPLLVAIYDESRKLVTDEKRAKEYFYAIRGRMDRACLGEEEFSNRMRSGEYRPGEACKPGSRLVVQDGRPTQRPPGKVERQSTSSDNYQRIETLFNRLIAFLQAGQIEPAVALFVTEDQARMRALFTQEAKALPVFVASLGKPTGAQMSGTTARLNLVRKEAGGNYAVSIGFSMGPDEVWRINGF